MTIEIFAPPRRLAVRLWGRARSIRLFSPGALLVGLFATFYALVIFAAWPETDLSVAGWFYHNGTFFGPGGLAGTLRKIFYWTPTVLLAVAIALFVARRRGIAVPWAPNGRQLVFLVATMALGPGLLVNIALKDHSHRPRPVQVEQFGGSMPFEPFYRFDGACRRNCSFVSGETSTAVWTLGPASLAPAPWRAEAVAAAFTLSVATSALRLAFGGHFLSDVVFSGLFTFLVLYALNRLLLSPAAAKSEDAASGLPDKRGSL
ncbi:MAG TPA: phosphatase PAP2 family protein [Beijerinckiaceae bacterium]|nr:phosphatase PAP2 family protein [Beijerinckiaceae bacterium]